MYDLVRDTTNTRYGYFGKIRIRPIRHTTQLWIYSNTTKYEIRPFERIRCRINTRSYWYEVVLRIPVADSSVSAKTIWFFWTPVDKKHWNLILKIAIVRTYYDENLEPFGSIEWSFVGSSIQNGLKRIQENMNFYYYQEFRLFMTFSKLFRWLSQMSPRDVFKISCIGINIPPP